MARSRGQRDRGEPVIPAARPITGAGAWWSVGAVVATILAASLAGVSNRFTQDDVAIILMQDRVHDLSQLGAIFGEPYWQPPAAPDLYRPLTLVLLAVQYVVGMGSPVIFRLLSIALYAGAAIALMRLATRELPSGLALWVALLFAAHPVHVEAVTLAVAQNEILVALLTLLTVTRYLDRRRGGNRDGRLGAGDWSLIAIAYLAAALLKEQGFLLPLFLLLAEACLVHGKPVAGRIRALWMGYAWLALIGIVVAAARTAVLDGEVGPTMLAEALRGQTIAGRTLTMLQIVPEWFRLLVWPAHLRADYSPAEFVASVVMGPREWLGAAIILVVAVVAWGARRRARLVTFGIAWAALAMLPVSNVLIPTGILVAERTLFLASAGVMLALGGAAAGFTEWISRRSSPPRASAAMLRRAAVGLAAALLTAGLVRSAARHRDWRDSTSLTVASLRDSPRSWRVWQSQGELLFDGRRSAEGTAAFERAIAFAPEPWRARNRLAQRLRTVGDDRAALDQLERSLLEHPGEPETMAQLPPTLIALGRYTEARDVADRMIRQEGPHQILLWMRAVADSALLVNAPPGSIRIGIGER